MEPDEHTFKWALATLLMAHYDEPPPPTHIYKKLKDVKQSWAAERKAFVHEQARVFPDDPYGLPDHIFKDAYPDPDNQPTKVVLVGINTVAESIPLRSNSKLLTEPSKHKADVRDAFTRTKHILSGSHEEPPITDGVVAWQYSHERPSPDGF